MTMHDTPREVQGLDESEIRDWLESLDAVIDRHGLTATGRLLREVTRRAEHAGVHLPFTRRLSTRSASTTSSEPPPTRIPATWSTTRDTHHRACTRVPSRKDG